MGKSKTTRDVDMDDGEAPAKNVLDRLSAHSKLSKKQKRKMEALKRQEEAKEQQAAEEVGLEPEEVSKRRLRAKQLAEFREAKSRIAVLKRKRSALGKKSTKDRDAKRKLGKEIKSIMSTLKAKHQQEQMELTGDMPIDME